MQNKGMFWQKALANGMAKSRIRQIPNAATLFGFKRPKIAIRLLMSSYSLTKTIRVFGRCLPPLHMNDSHANNSSAQAFPLSHCLARLRRLLR